MSTPPDGQLTRVLIADDHPTFLAGLRTLLELIPGTEIVGEAKTGAAAIEAARRLGPDIVIMDIDMPTLSGIEATRVIRTECPGTAVLVLTMSKATDTIFAAMRAGARGYLLKGSGLDDITRAVAAVRGGGAVFGPEVAGEVVDHVTRPAADSVPFPELTDRERAVLELIADGRGNAEIARRLGLSIKTVRNYLSRIFVKLRVADRTEAAVRARREGLGH
jgi:DNA-binding NarL/FixJ family response regulator